MTERPAGKERVVARVKNRIRFLGRVNSRAHREFMYCLYEWRARAFKELVLDFAICERAYLWGMLPLLAEVDRIRREGGRVSVLLPRDEMCLRLFHNTNWAHYLDPESYEKMHADPIETEHTRHVAAHRFSDRSTQHALVDAFMDVVMRNMALERRLIHALEWSLNEITDNVLNHAECPDGGLVQVNTFSDVPRVAVGVVDSGQGVLSSLRRGHPTLRTDDEALLDAMKEGRTRDPTNGQGNGLWGTMRIAKASGGRLEITSGSAQIVVPQGPEETYRRGSQQVFPGTFVFAEFGLEAPGDFEDVLGEPGSRPDIVETMYETTDGDALVLRLCHESGGFGTRSAGRELRMKCRNLLDAEPTKPLLLDWRGVRLRSSSFADELVGKLFVELTPLVFSARVRNIGMEPVVSGLVNKAILQRAAQTAAANDADATTTESPTEPP